MYDYDFLVIGAGPGGYVSAIRAGQLGLKAAIVEKDKPGGVCLNVGCIPSKALIRQAELFSDGQKALRDAGAQVDLSAWKYEKVWKKSRDAAERLSKGVEFLLKKNNVQYIPGTARLAGPHEAALDGGRRITAAVIVLATGSRPREIPGFAFDEKVALSSTGVLMAQELPKRLLVLGAGAIGMELAYVMNAFGVEVTVVELLPRALPLEDPEASNLVAKEFGRRGVKILTETRAMGMKAGKKGVAVTLKGPDGAEASLEADQLLVAVGRAPNSEGLGLEEIGVRTERGFVQVGDYLETSVRGVYAIGDLIPTPALAHVASKEGEIAAEHAAHVLKGTPLPRQRAADPLLIPSAVYCDPQVASFGLSEEKAKAAGQAFEVARFPYRGIGKAVAVERAEGFIKLLHEPRTGEILGATVVGESATEILHELLLARGAELTTEDVADLIHAHPTISEGVMEASRAALGRAIHA